MHLTQVHAPGDGDQATVNQFVEEQIRELERLQEQLQQQATKNQGGRKRRRAREGVAVEPTPKKLQPRQLPWVTAARTGDLETLVKMAAEKMWKWDDKDIHGSTAEQYAAGSGQLECLKYCLAFRFETCEGHRSIALDKENDRTSMGTTSLAEEKANQSDESDGAFTCTCEPTLSKRRDGRNSLHWAARNGQRSIVDFLIRVCRFKVDATTFDGTTALMYAVFGCQLETAKLLVTLGASPSKANNWSCDLTHWVSITRCSDKKLVAQMCNWIKANTGLDFCRAQKEGRTPLHKAAFINNLGLVDWMDANGLLTEENLLKQDLGKQTAAELAATAGFHELAQRLSVRT